MEDPSYSSDIHTLSEACRLLRLDPNYSPVRSDFADDDDDPLGRPEITVNINNDWTVSPKEHLPVLEDDLSEDSGEDTAEEDADVNSDDDKPITSFLNEMRTFPPRTRSSSVDEEHVVPSIIPTKVSRLMLDKESISSGTRPVNEEEGEGKKEDEEEEEVLDKETADEYHVEKETGDRSNPQPP